MKTRVHSNVAPCITLRKFRVEQSYGFSVIARAFSRSRPARLFSKADNTTTCYPLERNWASPDSFLRERLLFFSCPTCFLCTSKIIRKRGAFKARFSLRKIGYTLGWSENTSFGKVHSVNVSKVALWYQNTTKFRLDLYCVRIRAKSLKFWKC